ncbi:VCBS repeat-containing protein [Streptomyces sp. ITFR-16]|uniref:FG-GAP repeat domain-containing protein n=1 Tax=Streptomyces sp. ITFR-16 TaxID=3075198 RepID=UPI00288A7BA2|nr:VCBS repeat-containing protein [Streptomyces sp. ITFR-16]WNI27269.1 VCBS repeat-containing protein [Streptomyces sp. ITFR-16]
MLLAVPAPASADDAAPAQPAAAPAKPRLDVNGDGHSDLMYRGLDGVLYVRTSANIAYPYTIRSTDTSEMPKDIIAPGDLDGSGSPEILTLSASGTLSLFESAGEESTGKVRWSGTGWQKYNKVISPGDLNGDGRSDLLARTPSGDLYEYTSTGKVDSAPFKAGVKVGYGWGSYDQIVGANDVNGDGIGDVVARTPGGDLYFYAATGDPAKPLKKRVKAGYGFDIYNQLVAAEDINGDGRGDLMARTQNGDVYTYRSNGYGGFRYRVADTFGWSKAAQFVGEGGNPDYGKRELEGRTNAGHLW